MTNEEDGAKEYKAGLEELKKDKPDYNNALVHLHKALISYEAIGNSKKIEEIRDKINSVNYKLYKMIYNQAETAFAKGDLRNALNYLKMSYSYLIKSKEKVQKGIKMIKKLLESVAIEYLYRIENNTLEKGYSEGNISDLSFVETILVEILFPELKLHFRNSYAKNLDHLNLLIRELSDYSKIQKVLIRAYESVASSIIDHAKNLIEKNDLDKAGKLLDLGKKIYEQLYEDNEVEKISKLFLKINEGKGDKYFSLAKEYYSKGRLEKARDILKKAVAKYQKAENEKKRKIAINLYLDISVEMGKQYIKIAEDAAKINHINEAISYYEQALDFFLRLKEKNYPKQIRQKLEKYYNILGEEKLEQAESLNEDVLIQKYGESFFKEYKSKVHDYEIYNELLLNKLQLYHDALFYFEKAKNRMQIARVNRKIEQFTEQLAEYYFNTAKLQLKNELFEHAFLNFEKSKYYYGLINKEKKIRKIRELKTKAELRLNQRKLALINENINKMESRKSEILKRGKSHLTSASASSVSSAQSVTTITQDGTISKKSDIGDNSNMDAQNLSNNASISEPIIDELIGSAGGVIQQSKGDFSDLQTESKKEELYRCKKCGKAVPALYYDAIQECCFDCRETIVCDECGNEIPPNEVFQTCVVCKKNFCLNCAELVFDFNQKRCSTHRIVQECAYCGRKSELNETFYTCPECGLDFCSDHFDLEQNLCINCRKYVQCHICGEEIKGDEIYQCMTCHEYFCSEHFDIGRNQCINCAKSEICAFCGENIPKNGIAIRCPECGFVVCKKHFSEYHNKCYKCLPKDLRCSISGNSVYEQDYYICQDCGKIFCKEHFNIKENRCIN
ncbi:MAG: hypothetical protein ACTSU2_12590, partial [Promethearchaeota archaeon]